MSFEVRGKHCENSAARCCKTCSMPFSELNSLILAALDARSLLEFLDSLYAAFGWVYVEKIAL